MSTDSVWFASLADRERQELAAMDQTEILTTPDLLVVGAGIVGLAIAYFASLRGMRVQVVDAGPLGSGATGANAGGICPNVDGLDYPPEYAPLAMLSRDLWGRLSLRPGFDFDWRVPGFLIVDPERFSSTVQQYAADCQERGFTMQAVDEEQINRLEPALRRGIGAGVLSPSEAHLHPVRAALSLARVAARNGSRVRTGARVTGSKVAGDRVRTVETTIGPIVSERVVVAAGWRSDRIGEFLPRPSWIHPVAGQMLATDPLPPLLNRPVAGKYLIVQLRTGEVVTGGDEYLGERVTPNPEMSAEIAAAAAELVPELKGARFTRSWCGIRPGTPDGLPVIDRSPQVENLHFACGHFKKGVLLAPACGKLLADWICDGTRPAELDFFNFARFGVGSG